MPSHQRKNLLERELRRMLPTLIDGYRPEKVILFGSLATGQLHEWSDIDLAIIKRTPKRFLDRISEVLSLVSPTVACDVVVYTPEEYDQMRNAQNFFVLNEIERRGKILYDQDQ